MNSHNQSSMGRRRAGCSPPILVKSCPVPTNFIAVLGLRYLKLFIKMGYNDVFKDIIQPVKTAHNCVGDSHVAMEMGNICDGTA